MIITHLNGRVTVGSDSSHEILCCAVLVCILYHIALCYDTMYHSILQFCLITDLTASMR